MHARSLGMDIGDKRIGVALSDPTGILARPLEIIDRINESQDIEAIINIIHEYGIGQIVVGLPRSMDGSIGEQANKVMAFIQRLSQRTEVPIEFRDERLTTISAQRLMRATVTKKDKRKKRNKDDAVAAAIILQNYLDEATNSQLF